MSGPRDLKIEHSTRSRFAVLHLSHEHRLEGGVADAGLQLHCDDYFLYRTAIGHAITLQVLTCCLISTRKRSDKALHNVLRELRAMFCISAPPAYPETH